MYSTEQLNILIIIFGLSVSLAILLFLRTSGDRDSKLNRLFTRIIVCNIAAMLLTMTTQLLIGTPYININRVIGFLSYLAINLLLPLLADYIFALIERSRRLSRLLPRIIYAAYGIWAISMVISEFTGFYYYYPDGSEAMQFTKYYWVSQMFSAATLVILTTVIIHYRKNLGRNDVFYLLFFPVLSIATIIIQVSMGDDILTLIYITNAIFALFCYGGIQARQAKLLRDKELELAENRVAVMLSQIQPHFLYNSLSAIQDLCVENPESARIAVIEFANYLRGNLDSLGHKLPISFERELKHVDTYLLLEKRRFEDKLQIVYDIDVLDFELPSLTLQPIAENAVRHGVTKKHKGGTVTISTFETDTAYKVTVVDDGVGFDANAQPATDGPGHIGISNVRSRLASMCSGTLDIESTPGKGTKATITIPK